MQLGQLYHEAERLDEAAAAFLKASELVPNDVYTQLVLYSYLTSMERTEEAEAVAQRITEYQERQAELQRQLEEAQAEAIAEAENGAEPETGPEMELEAASEPAGEEESEN